MGIQITGIGAYSPSRVVTNGELARTVDTSHEWIVSHTGIRERRIAAPDETPSTMGYQAALRCLRDAGVEREEVDLIVVACATPDQSQPAVACMIQEKLGIAERHCPAFDVNSVCAGFVFALDVAQSMMLANPRRYRNALVIGADAFSKILNWEDRRTCIFFGDGAGAVLLSQTRSGERRIHCALGSDGRGRHCIEVPAGGTRQPVDAEVLEKRLNKFVMQGPKVWEFAINTVPTAIRALLGEHGMRPAAASLPITLQRAAELGKLRPGARVALCGFGGGLSWGAALLEL
jgi:3-oxoacyl-[acyl-carrier-protein] synthase-3